MKTLLIPSVNNGIGNELIKKFLELRHEFAGNR